MLPKARHVPLNLRREVAQRAKQLCDYCRCPDEFSADSFTIDQIQPRQRGGVTTLENLAWACFGCNGRKPTRMSCIDPSTGETAVKWPPQTGHGATSLLNLGL